MKDTGEQSRGMSNKKVIKIYPKMRIINKGTIFRDYYETSQIKIEGNYLVDAGFLPNEKINVEVMNGLILITKI